MAGMRASIYPPHNSEFETLFQSLAWTIVFRVLSPLAAFHTCIVAVYEVVRLTQYFWVQRRLARASLPVESIRTAELLIVVIEAPIMFFIGTILVFGEYGPNMLPYTVHRVGFFLFTGASVVTTLIVALLMREEARGVMGLPRRHLFGHLRLTVTSITLFFLGCDCFYAATVISGKEWNNATLVLLIGYVIFFVTQGGAAIYFFVQARAFGFALFKGVLEPPRLRNQAHERKIMRFYVWLMVSGFACTVATFILVGTLLMLGGPLAAAANPTLVFWGAFIFAGSRILVSNSQVYLHNFNCS